MKRLPRTVIFIVALVLGSILLLMFFSLISGAGLPWETASLEEVVDDVAENRAMIYEEDSSVDFGDENEINVLFLGLDSRKGASDPHCDAIHMFTLNVQDWTVKITSVPRGTYSYIPPGNYGENEYYLANACAYAGLDYGIIQIEKIVGVKADYYATVGFSQVLGIVRLFGLPPTDTLQFLRHRQGYAIGDPQRSHNQAVFMKDMIINQLDRFRSDFGMSVLYVVFNMIDTDMDFATAKTFFDGYLKSEIDDRPDDIVLEMRPYYETKDYHFDPETSPEQLAARLKTLDHWLSDEDLSNKTIEEIQEELLVYLHDRLEIEDSVADIFEKQLWYQVEDAEVREDIHYRFLEKYAYELVELDQEFMDDLLSDYIIEKEAFGLNKYAKRAMGLKRYLIVR